MHGSCCLSLWIFNLRRTVCASMWLCIFILLYFSLLFYAFCCDVCFFLGVVFIYLYFFYLHPFEYNRVYVLMEFRFSANDACEWNDLVARQREIGRERKKKVALGLYVNMIRLFDFNSSETFVRRTSTKYVLYFGFRVI